MAVLKIVTLEQPIIRKSLKSVPRVNGEIQKLLRDMNETVLKEQDPEGVGLAANQVGIDKRIFLAKIGSEFLPFINPEITHFSPEFVEEFEGCLSIPDIFGFVKRAKSVSVRYQNTQGKIKERTFEGLPARIMQHEMDHLNGKLFVDHVKQQTRELFHYVGANDKGEPEFEKISLDTIGI